MWGTIAEFHAAANDLPPALFVASIVFDIVGRTTKRESLNAAAFWTLTAAAVGAVIAVASGLLAENSIEHGAVMHRTVERHQTLAIGFTLMVSALAVWRIWRRSTFSGREAKLYLAGSMVTFFSLLWAASLGGDIVFRHAGGIETTVLESVITERQAGHMPAPNEDHADAGEQTTEAPSVEDEEHSH